MHMCMCMYVRVCVCVCSEYMSVDAYYYVCGGVFILIDTSICFAQLDGAVEHIDCFSAER